MGATRIEQMTLVTDIMKLLADKHGATEVSARHINAVITAADGICAEFGRDDIVAKAGAGLAAWLASDGVGASAYFMAKTLAPLAGLGACPHHRYDGGVRYPYDPDDLSRCLGLLDAVPQLREHLAALAPTHPAWALYVARWDEMEALFKEESPQRRAPKLNRLMKQLQDEASR